MAKEKRGYKSMFGGLMQTSVEQPNPHPEENNNNLVVVQEPGTVAKKKGRPKGSLGKKPCKIAVSLKIDGALLEHLRNVSDTVGIPFSRMVEDASRHFLLSTDWKFLLEDVTIENEQERDLKLDEERKKIERRYRDPNRDEF